MPHCGICNRYIDPCVEGMECGLPVDRKGRVWGWPVVRWVDVCMQCADEAMERMVEVDRELGLGVGDNL